MTVQVADNILYKRRKFRISPFYGLFDPEQFDLDLSSMSTACWRGYVATYVVKSGDLLLRNLDCWTYSPIPINGHLPINFELGSASYTKLEIPIPYTGPLILEGYSNNVHELHFEQGHLVEAIDRTDEISPDGPIVRGWN